MTREEEKSQFRVQYVVHHRHRILQEDQNNVIVQVDGDSSQFAINKGVYYDALNDRVKFLASAGR